MSRLTAAFGFITIILFMFTLGVLAFPVNQSDIENTEDYPADTHVEVGSVKAFSQLVSDDSSSSRANRDRDYSDASDGEDSSEETREDDGDIENAELKVKEDDAPEEDSDTQYLIEEVYGYTYDEATGTENTDFDDDV